MITMYYADCFNGDVVPVECKVVGYPNVDADGQTDYDTTHFATEADAWQRVIADIEARNIRAAYYYRSVLSRVDNAKTKLADVELLLDTARKRRDAWAAGQAAVDAP